MIKLEHNDLDNLLFCLLFTKGYLDDDKLPLKEYRKALDKWIDQTIEDILGEK